MEDHCKGVPPVPVRFGEVAMDFMELAADRYSVRSFLDRAVEQEKIDKILKAAFDRLFAIAECDSNYRNPKMESVLIMASEGAGFEESGHW